MINDCLTTGTFPDELKCSRIVPIFKDNDPCDPNNNRPISILPSLSKIFESIICDRLNGFLSRHKVIHPNQFGFQKNSGTLSAACTLIDTIQNEIDSNKNNITCKVDIDLRKAFETVPHKNLLEKLENYGIRGPALNLLRHYLNAREQLVDNADTHSQILINDNPFALPQGSNLGPLLFIIYINGIFDLKLNGTLILYADDAVLTYTSDNLENTQIKMQEDLQKISLWLKYNKLTININKTKYMLLKPDYLSTDTSNFFLNIDDCPIERVYSLKYLGLIIQSNLKWDIHIDAICRKISSFSSVFNRLGNRIDPRVKREVYFAMIHSHLTYLSPVWSTTTTEFNLNRLQIAQNNAIRKIFNYEYFYEGLSTESIREKYKIMNVRQLIQYNNAIMIFKISRNAMKSNYSLNVAGERRYNTRAAARPRASAFRTNLGKNSVYRSCTELFYNMQLDQITSTSNYSFKKQLKNIIFEQHN